MNCGKRAMLCRFVLGERKFYLAVDEQPLACQTLRLMLVRIAMIVSVNGITQRIMSTVFKVTVTGKLQVSNKLHL